MFAYLYVYVCAHVHVCMHMLCVYVYVCVCVCMCMCVYVYVCVHTLHGCTCCGITSGVWKVSVCVMHACTCVWICLYAHATDSISAYKIDMKNEQLNSESHQSTQIRCAAGKVPYTYVQ